MLCSVHIDSALTLILGVEGNSKGESVALPGTMGLTIACIMCSGSKGGGVVMEAEAGVVETVPFSVPGKTQLMSVHGLDAP